MELFAQCFSVFLGENCVIQKDINIIVCPIRVYFVSSRFKKNAKLTIRFMGHTCLFAFAGRVHMWWQKNRNYMCVLPLKMRPTKDGVSRINSEGLFPVWFITLAMVQGGWRRIERCLLSINILLKGRRTRFSDASFLSIFNALFPVHIYESRLAHFKPSQRPSAPRRCTAQRIRTIIGREMRRTTLADTLDSRAAGLVRDACTVHRIVPRARICNQSPCNRHRDHRHTLDWHCTQPTIINNIPRIIIYICGMYFIRLYHAHHQ